ncbi:hypothetical protein FB451DRAFT_1174600 [Mycena latifolia]|nr:hypothetical protein FB451DRAFT_1195851 [Mycena latifolia]KAJ7474072.1 hypothetical protein FB451DRAFT_1174600 [Mycena latifolia]
MLSHSVLPENSRAHHCETPSTPPILHRQDYDGIPRHTAREQGTIHLGIYSIFAGTRETCAVSRPCIASQSYSPLRGSTILSIDCFFRGPPVPILVSTVWKCSASIPFPQNQGYHCRQSALTAFSMFLTIFLSPVLMTAIETATTRALRGVEARYNPIVPTYLY